MRAEEAASRRRWTLVLVNLASVLEKADEVLLPAVYREVGVAVGASPTALGSLTLCRALVQTASYPLAAYASARHDRARVVAVGAFLWAAATFLVSISSNFLQMAISRGLHGIGLALVLPAISSLVADYTDDHTRGAAFGWLQMTRNLGSILGGSFGVLLAPITFLGIAGWRLAFHAVAMVSVALGVLMWLLAADPRAKSKTRKSFSGTPGASSGSPRSRSSSRRGSPAPSPGPRSTSPPCGSSSSGSRTGRPASSRGSTCSPPLSARSSGASLGTRSPGGSAKPEGSRLRR